MKFRSILFPVLALCSCSTPPKVKSSSGLPAEIIALNLPGQQSDPAFSSSGEKILYISWERKEHAHKQVYEYDFTSQREQRVTFQDGENKFPSYWTESKIIYSSNTDEIKENVFSLYGADKSEWFELYSSDLVGEDIDRLTQRPGLDDKALRDPWGKGGIFFISNIPQPGIYHFTNETKRRQLLIAGQFEQYFIYQNTKSLVGLEKTGLDKTFFEYSILSKLKKSYPLPTRTVATLAETPWNDVFLMVEWTADLHSNLFFWKPKSQCISNWKTLPWRVTQLQISPKGANHYIMTIIKEEKENIYMLNELPQSPPCEQSPTSSKLEP